MRFALRLCGFGCAVRTIAGRHILPSVIVAIPNAIKRFNRRKAFIRHALFFTQAFYMTVNRAVIDINFNP